MRSPVWCLLLVSPCLGAQSPTIELEPSHPMVLGDPVGITAAGLPPGQEITLLAETVSEGQALSSSATFLVPPDGRIELGRDAPLMGDYAGVDELGLFWSMAALDVTSAVDSPPDRSEVALGVEGGGELLATRTLTRFLRAPGVESSEVREQGLVATFYRPAGAGPHPAVLLVGGSDGGIGWQRSMGSLFASKGYAALALAYFGMPSLPPNLELVPLEYFGTALDWMAAQPSVDGDRLAVCGVSKGGELALLLGAEYSSLRAVVAFVPSSVVFQGIAPSWPLTSSWSRGGEGLPFVPYDQAAARSGADLLELYEASLGNEEAVRSARIPVERTRGAVLVVSGSDDTIWPSQAMGAEVIAHLAEVEHPYPFEHLAFEGAGHSIAGPWDLDLGGPTRNGGSARVNAAAGVHGWRRTLGFLAENLKSKDAPGNSPR